MEAKRICPYCMGELESRVSVCPHCGGVLAGRNPAGRPISVVMPLCRRNEPCIIIAGA